MRKRMIAGNWKMNKTYSEGVVLAQGLADELAGGTGDVDVVVCPPAVDLKGVSEVIEQLPRRLRSARRTSTGRSPAPTPARRPQHARGRGRHPLHHRPLRAPRLLWRDGRGREQEGQGPHGSRHRAISCCGESLEIREAGTHVKFVVDQIKKDTEGLQITDPSKYVIAYEPIWAIGTGKTATADDAQEVCGAIRATLVEIFGEEIASGIRILYGGSAKPENIAGFLRRRTLTARSSVAPPSRRTASPRWSRAPWRKTRSKGDRPLLGKLWARTCVRALFSSRPEPVCYHGLSL